MQVVARGGGARSLWLGLLVGAAVWVGCSAEEARDAVVRELALGSWACAADEDPDAQPLTVRIEDDGTFGVAFEAAPADEVPLPRGELTGTWAIEDGDLRWGFDGPRPLGPFTVPGFDALHLESTRFVLENPGFFGDEDVDDVTDEQVVDVEAHSKDSVSFSVPGGDPWTCDRET